MLELIVGGIIGYFIAKLKNKSDEIADQDIKNRKTADQIRADIDREIGGRKK